MEYVVRMRVLTQGGTVTNTHDQLLIEGADEVVFLITADTDYLIISTLTSLIRKRMWE